MKRLSSTQDRADATILETCVDMWFTVGERVPSATAQAAEALCGLAFFAIQIAAIVAFPISFPVIAWFFRRQARREVAEWNKRHTQYAGHDE